MIDYARITAKAGDGGAGSGSFRHIKGKRYGRADGGDGGCGGNVYIEAVGDLSTLEPYRYVKDYQAADGRGGASNLRKGADGQDLVLKVPVGTVISVSQRVGESPLRSAMQSSAGQAVNQNSELLTHRITGSPTHRITDTPNHRITDTPNHRITAYDLTEIGQRVLIARGGEGGRGNAKLRDEFGRRPRMGEAGRIGESGKITLELKLIADVGLVGLPNAGKSTLLSALTAARPAIAAYPFTTLEPNLGVLSVDQWISESVSQQTGGSVSQSHRLIDSLVLADIPGLIEGASQGKGLGDLFLRHIERTKILVHLIDASTESNKWQDYRTVRGELKNYSKELVKKKEIIILTKADLADQLGISKAIHEFARHRKKTIAISAQTGEGLGDLVKEMYKKVK